MIGFVRSAAHARFWTGLGEARRSALEAFPDWSARLEAALADARRTWAEEWLAAELFSAELAARLESDEAEISQWWEHLHAADLYLAAACARGIPEAIRRFELVYGDEIARTARRFERSGLSSEDLVQLLRAKLFAGATGDGTAVTATTERPKISSYTGQGFLQNWVRVTATRTFIDCARARGDSPEVLGDDHLNDVLPEPGPDPELQLLKREHLAHFKAAFAEAVGGLDSSHRLVLKQSLLEGLTIDQLAGLYHLHRATAARRLAKAREALLVATRAALARRLGLPVERLVMVLELVASRLEASVERLLG
jgi:RNA polymerase sigma-70 factor (ECF subfamily)